MVQDIKIIQENILSWYDKNGRKLPRRQIYPTNGGAIDPYAIHISEVMLQQTQVDRVIPYFHKRMKDFPDYSTLAKASKTDLLSHRSGLGFNSRALRLQTCAQTIITKNGPKVAEKLTKNGLKGTDSCLKISNSKFQIPNGKTDFTELRAELQKLPGIGPYTSAAIMAFSRNISVPVIDTNIRRVLIFLFKLPETISPKVLEAFAATVIPRGKSRDRHNALMDQGALLLTARKTKIKPLSKQSKFEGSDRQVRGWTMKQLVTNNEQLTIKRIEEEFPHKQVKKIVKDLQKEGLIQIKKGIICISE